MPQEKKVRLFCTDLDGTLLGDAAQCREFVTAWKQIKGDKPYLIYSTGRLEEDAKQMIRKHRLPTPDFYITGVGTMICDAKNGIMMPAFAKLLNENWNREKAHAILSKVAGIRPQSDEQQHAWKCSWFWENKTEDEIEGLRKLLSDESVRAQVIYSTSLDLDILPEAANKGNAIEWLANDLHIGLDEVVVAGDSGNDSSMFLKPGIRGIAPNNASPELIENLKGAAVYFAKHECTSGVIEGLKHFQVFS